jgi:hypothetical protein
LDRRRKITISVTESNCDVSGTLVRGGEICIAVAVEIAGYKAVRRQTASKIVRISESEFFARFRGCDLNRAKEAKYTNRDQKHYRGLDGSHCFTP